MNGNYFMLDISNRSLRAKVGTKKLPIVEGQDRDSRFRSFGSSEDRLFAAAASTQLARHGQNRIRFHRARSPWLMLANEFVALFPLLLPSASGLPFFAHRLSPTEGCQLLGFTLADVLILNALVAFAQNYKVEKLMLSFLDYIPKPVPLLRDEQKVLVDAEEMVPGDILLLREGEIIPADGVLIECADLMLDESILTGESEPVEKIALKRIVEPCNIISSGATVIRGDATALITRTGRTTTLGAISGLSTSVKRDLTPMQKELAGFVRYITWLAFSIGLIFFVIGFAIGNTFWSNLIFAIGIRILVICGGKAESVSKFAQKLGISASAHNRRRRVIPHKTMPCPT
jgi:sodium/potassium-transporting ATPase subunit alpha